MNAGSGLHEHKCSIPIGGNARLFYCADDYTDPWASEDVVLMLHGIAEEAAIWRAWVPHLARRHRVIRPDLRGFGRSSPLPPGYSFALADWADDLERLVEHLGCDRVHLVGTKLGALVACELAQRRRNWLASLTLVGMLASARASLGPWVEEWVSEVQKNGVEGWARLTMPGRMGASLSPAAMDWWIHLMGGASAEAVIACLRLLPELDGPPQPERIRCPTLFLVSAGSAARGAAYDQRPSSTDIERLRRRIPGSELREIEADSYHIAATHPDRCAAATSEFIARINAAAQQKRDPAAAL